MKKINVRNIFLALGILGFSAAFVFAGELVEKGKGYRENDNGGKVPRR